MTRQPNTRQQIIAVGVYLAMSDSEDFTPGSAARVRFWQDLRSRPRCIAVGRVTSGGSVQMWTAEDEYQFQIARDEKLCKPDLDADPEYLPLSDAPGYSESLQPWLW